MSPDGRLMAVCGRFGNIHLLTTRTKEWVGTMKVNGEVKAVAFNSNGSRLFSHGGSDIFLHNNEFLFKIDSLINLS